MANQKAERMRDCLLLAPRRAVTASVPSQRRQLPQVWATVPGRAAIDGEKEASAW